MRGRKRPPPDESDAIDEYKSDAKSSTDETPSVRRPDRAQRIADNKTVDFVTIKTTLNAFCKRRGGSCRGECCRGKRSSPT
jgi:hypothetical protein